METKLSSKGQIVLPKSIRDARAWRAGTEFTIEEKGNAIVLRPKSLFRPKRIEDVAGMLAYKGKPKTIEEMDAGIAKMVKERRARGRY
jgi:AbrB family looped-hinge helix DNA binding protein